MTRFIDSFTTQQLLPPWQTRGARFWAFIIKTAPQCMQNYLDTHFNSPGPDIAPFHYRVRDESGYGMLFVADHPDFSSGYAGIEGWDTVAHREVYWSFPAFRYDVTADNILGRPHAVWIQPFYFDDNSLVMFSSREIWGSEKQMGDITIEEGSAADLLHIDLATQGFAKFSPRSASRTLAVMHARLLPGTKPVGVEEVLLQSREIAGFGGAMLASFDLLGAPPPDSPGLNPGTEINTLKQFRDVFDMRAAVYRAIVASRTTRNHVRDVAFYKGDRVELDFMWSDSMAEQFVQLFGLAKPEGAAVRTGHVAEPPLRGNRDADWQLPRVRVQVECAVSFTCDAHFEVIDTLHTYGAAAAT
ncbi:MAG: hypothetical protein ACO25F_03565 [Erythrobacter sp.]